MNNHQNVLIILINRNKHRIECSRPSAFSDFSLLKITILVSILEYWC